MFCFEHVNVFFFLFIQIRKNFQESNILFIFLLKNVTQRVETERKMYNYFSIMTIRKRQNNLLLAYFSSQIESVTILFKTLVSFIFMTDINVNFFFLTIRAMSYFTYYINQVLFFFSPPNQRLKSFQLPCKISMTEVEFSHRFNELEK